MAGASWGGAICALLEVGVASCTGCWWSRLWASVLLASALLLVVGGLRADWSSDANGRFVPCLITAEAASLDVLAAASILLSSCFSGSSLVGLLVESSSDFCGFSILALEFSFPIAGVLSAVATISLLTIPFGAICRNISNGSNHVSTFCS